MIDISNKGSLRILTFNNPSKRNAWNAKSFADIAAALNAAAIDDSVNLVALTGVGNFYSSGNDLSAAMNADDPVEYGKSANTGFQQLVRAHINFPKLLIAVVNGPCIGIAASTAALCDVIYATTNSYFYTPFALLGLAPEGCSSFTFPRILGRSKAAEMLLLNHTMMADEALRFNFVSEVFTPAELTSKLWPRIESFTKLPKESLLVTKRLLMKFNQEKLEEVHDTEVIELTKRMQSEEFLNGMVQYNIKRKSKL